MQNPHMSKYTYEYKHCIESSEVYICKSPEHTTVASGGNTEEQEQVQTAPSEQPPITDTTVASGGNTEEKEQVLPEPTDQPPPVVNIASRTRKRKKIELHDHLSAYYMPTRAKRKKVTCRKSTLLVMH